MKQKELADTTRTTMVGKKIIKLSTLSLSMMCLTMAYAAEPEETTGAEPKAKVVKVAVTGSSIKGVAAQSASPITIIKAEEFQKQGVTTVEEALTNIAANQSSFTTANNVGTSKTSGSVADLRGLGSNKTLVLLNGRRLASGAFDSATVNLNIIPLAMLDRVEILRDGASAIYGTDAIGGVINFITKSSFTGFNATAEYLQPEASAGKQQQYSIFGGFGTLEDQGYNIYGVVNYRKADAVMAQDRDFTKAGGLLPQLGISRTSGGSFPANYYDIDADKSGNPYASTGCGGNPLNAPSAAGTTCRFNSQATIGIVPETEDVSFLGKLTAKITDDLNAVAEYVHAENKVTTIIAPDVFFGSGNGRTDSSDYLIPNTSKYYPGNGITPGVTGLSGGDLSLSLRSAAGGRVGETTSKSDRFLVGLEGETLGWDINTGVSYAKSTAGDALNSGYINNNGLRRALMNGTLNPFGAQAAEDGDVWGTLGVTGTYLKADLEATTVDFTASRSIFTLPAGDVGFAFGGSYRRDDWRSDQVTAITSVADSTGSDPNEPVSIGKREIKAAFAEFQIPLHKTLEAQLAARYDDYSDFGDTFNPKFALRWEPLKQLMFRGSYSTGFRAPSLLEMNSPNSKTNTAANYDDPILCPGGVLAPGGREVRDCGIQFDKMQGGNKTLEPEESKSFTLGTVFQPYKNLVFNIDYFNIELDHKIGVLSENVIFSDPEKYASEFIRNPKDGSLAYINNTYENMGNVKTSGLDVGMSWRTDMTDYGRFGFDVNGTYVTKYDYQDEKDGPYINNVGRYGSGTEYPGPVIRWKHNANLSWMKGDWSANLQQNFTRGYLDQNASDQNHDVDDYITYNLSSTYKGFKNLELTLGIKNLLDEDPPASNVEDNFQMAYDPRYSDPMGRTYFVRGTYKFF